MGGKKLLCFTGHRSFKVAWLSAWNYRKFAICRAIFINTLAALKISNFNIKPYSHCNAKNI